jgi:hypothetical protein
MGIPKNVSIDGRMEGKHTDEPLEENRCMAGIKYHHLEIFNIIGGEMSQNYGIGAPSWSDQLAHLPQLPQVTR